MRRSEQKGYVVIVNNYLFIRQSIKKFWESPTDPILPQSRTSEYEPKHKKQKTEHEKLEKPKACILFSGPLGHVEYFADFIQRADATKLRDILIKEVPWEKEEIVLFGKKITAPRLGRYCAFFDYLT